MFSDVAEEIEVAHRRSPVGIVNEASWVGWPVEIEEAAELTLDGDDVVDELLAGEQIALGGFPRGVADHTGGAARERDGVMAGELETPQRELAHEMADVERIAGWIETAVESQRSFAEALCERVEVGAIGEEAAP